MSRSIAAAVTRSLVTSVALTAAVVAIVGGSATAAIVLHRDDESARALARTMGSELVNHAGDRPAAHDELVRDELEEQHWFNRRLEVFRGSQRVGGGSGEARLFRFASEKDGSCRRGDVEGALHRVCVVQVAPWSIVVATPYVPILWSMAPLLAAIGGAAGLAAFAFSLLAARVTSRALLPLARFEGEVAAIPAMGRKVRVETSWQAVEIDALARTFNDLLARTEVAVQREQRFVADAAHELRTPLTRLRGQLELVRDQLGPGHALGSRVDLASTTCDELARTTEALLALARNEVRLVEAVDLNDVVGSAVGRFEESLRGRIRVEGNDDAAVRGDGALLGLAVTNLLDNALKYTDGPILVAVRRTGASVEVAVEDNGTGIADEELPRLLQPFARGRAVSARVRGSGLGLALVEHVTALHGGVLSLANRPSGGLLATLALPTWDTARATPRGG